MVGGSATLALGTGVTQTRTPQFFSALSGVREIIREFTRKFPGSVAPEVEEIDGIWGICDVFARKFVEAGLKLLVQLFCDSSGIYYRYGF